MRVLVVGAGGVGSAIATAADASEGLDHVVVTDLDEGRARGAVERLDARRFTGRALDASDPAAITALARAERVDVVVNACDPRLNPPIFHAAFDAGCHYVDMAMTLSEPHPERPYELPGRMLGDEQLAVAGQWRERGLLALVGMGVEPGLSRSERVDVVVNACDPRLNPPIFHAAFDAGCHYVDMAMTLSEPHPERPYELPGRMLGDEQLAVAGQWRERGLLALVGMGVEPGLS